MVNCGNRKKCGYLKCIWSNTPNTEVKYKYKYKYTTIQNVKYNYKYKYRKMSVFKYNYKYKYVFVTSLVDSWYAVTWCCVGDSLEMIYNMIVFLAVTHVEMHIKMPQLPLFFSLVGVIFTYGFRHVPVFLSCQSFKMKGFLLK